MMYTVAALPLFAAAALAQAGKLTIQTPPSVTTCQPTQISFTGGTGPYFLSILPGGEASAAPLETLPQQDSAGPITWNVDLPANTKVTLQLKDGTGALAFSDQVPIQAGSSTDCVNSSAAAGAPASSGASSAAAGASSAASSGASAASSGASAASSGASAAAPAASSGGSDSAAAGLSVGFSGVALAAAGVLLKAFF